MKKLTISAAVLALSGLQILQAARVDVYPQSFDAGGWKLDVQFMDVMGSPYLLAHGAGMRVVDAMATAERPKSGNWRVWVRSRKWVDGAGAFKVRAGGKEIARVFGVSQEEWDWEDGGELFLEAGKTEIVLEDQDGFDGRCAGIVLVDDGTKPTGALRMDAAAVSETVDADFVVVGGGIPGTCAAVAAARRGLKVALVQDRPVLVRTPSHEV